MTYFDLHLHTTASDGHFTPEEVVKKAKEIGLRAISITDHDTTAGLKEALEAGEKYGIEVIPGIELSTDYLKKEVHILGYFMCYQNDEFQKKLESFRNDRKARAIKMIHALNNLGCLISFEDVMSIAQNGTIGRPHVAQALVAKGYAKSISDAFEKFLGRGKPAYVAREKLTPQEAVKLIQSYQGIPVMAHPGIAGIDELISELVDAGLMGIEVYHPEHNLQDNLKYQIIAKKYKLLTTGGSDFHGMGNQTISSLGVPNVDLSVVSALKEAKEKLDNGIGKSN